MDFSQFDQRGRAEAGVFVQLHQPYDPDEMIEDEAGPCGFRVRGVAAVSVQQRLAAMQKKRKKAKKGETEEDDDKAFLEAIHESQIEQALGYIIEPVNISIDGVEMKGAEGIRRILNMTFPDIRIATDASGNRITTKVKGEDGEMVTIPKFEVVNHTFAGQAIKAAEDGSRFFGKTATT